MSILLQVWYSVTAPPVCVTVSYNQVKLAGTIFSFFAIDYHTVHAQNNNQSSKLFY